MSKAVLISIRPEWCEKIASEEKTIEIRKRRPKIETPFKCYIYCTKPSRSKMWRAGEYMCFNDDELYRDTKGRIKYGCSIELMACDDYSADNFLNGKVIGEFVCDQIEQIGVAFRGGDGPLVARGGNEVWKDGVLEYMSRLSTDDICRYIGGVGGTGYGWHISYLNIYDEPKPLRDFHRWNEECLYHSQDGVPICKKGKICSHCAVTRPPQSWCYVEELP